MGEMHGRVQESGCEVASMLPRKEEKWEHIIQDIMQSAAVDDVMRNLVAECEQHREMKRLTIDAAYKPCMPLLGQAPHGSTQAEHADQALPPADTVHAVVTILGISGAVVGVGAMHAEGAEHVKQVLVKELTMAQLDQVQMACSDNPSLELLQELQGVCQNLRSLSMDPLHIVMAYESAKGATSTAGSKFLRKIMQKFAGARGPKLDDEYYAGGTPKAPTANENKLLRMVKQKTMGKIAAQNVMDNLDSNVRFASRTEFVRCVAALVVLFPKEVRKKVAGMKSTIHQALVRIVAPGRAEWLMNHQRQRQRMSPEEAKLAPIGTTANEGLHFELNTWFRTIVRLHQTLLRLKLRMFHLYKLILHNSALYRPTTVQVPQAILGRRVLNAISPWGADGAWEAFCASEPLSRAEHQTLRTKRKVWLVMKKGVVRQVKLTSMRKRNIFRLYKGGRLKAGKFRLAPPKVKSMKVNKTMK
jgi:hypothetical protein